LAPSYQSIGGRGGVLKKSRLNLLDSIILDELFVKRVTYMMIIFFVIPLFLGIVLWDPLSNTFIGDYVKKSAESVKETAGSFRGIEYFLLPLVIFAKNTLVAVISAILAPLLIVPPIILATNGFLVGFVIQSTTWSTLALKLGGGVGLVTAAALAPHGAVEVPAISISASTVFYFIDYLRNREMRFFEILKRNLAISIIMLVFSAIIEAFITPIAAMIALIIGSM
jgi:uncharacterized membrane protein SpoIIM required for sporulation